jgi:mannitol-1-/sugar-/sorbitol-6-/2-deoxyglucose-6-phosphatase
VSGDAWVITAPLATAGSKLDSMLRIADEVAAALGEPANGFRRVHGRNEGMSSTRLIQAAIFDMDGTLIDSEPSWRRAEIDVFGALGVPLTEEMCLETLGQRSDQVVAHWYGRFPWSGKRPQDVEQELLEVGQERIVAEGRPMPGVIEALEACSRAGLVLGLASSSPYVLIDAVVDKLGIRRYFRALHSAETEAHSKPHPAVFVGAAARLGFSPDDCLAFEDSLPGVRSARAAGMIVIAVPPPELRDDPAFDEADLTLPSLEELSLSEAAARCGFILPNGAA